MIAELNWIVVELSTANAFDTRIPPPVESAVFYWKLQLKIYADNVLFRNNAPPENAVLTKKFEDWM